MFHFSFSTVCMAIIASNLLLILIAICVLHTKIMVSVGYKLLALFVGFTIIRFLLPFEFSFTTTVIFPEWLSMILSCIKHPYWQIHGVDITIWTFLQLIWYIGIGVNLIIELRKHSEARYLLLANSLDATHNERYQAILERICKERNKKNNFKILTVTGLNVPMLYGVFQPHILIPEDLPLSDAELYYSMTHEASHHFHHDLLLKRFVSFITAVYWWNPLCYLLKQQTDMLFEMRIDNKIATASEDTRTNYLNCLLNLQIKAVGDSTPLSSVGISLLSIKEDIVIKRFEMLAHTNQKKVKIINIACSLLVVGLFLWSYLFIYEPSYISPSVRESTLSITEGDGYAVLKEDGTYDIYFYGILTDNVDSLECFPPDIPIYTEKELINEEN